jgi:hypothetical protein
MEKVLNTTMDCRGNETPTAILYQEGGLLRMWEVVCLSSADHGLGNCQCVSHPATEETPVSTQYVIEQFGKEALDGFELHTTEQIIFDTFGIEIDELETFIKTAYRLDMNPLPFLRKKTNHSIVFLDGSIDMSAFEEEVVFVVNSRGEISAEINK